jgi:hypothetical protein
MESTGQWKSIRSVQLTEKLIHRRQVPVKLESQNSAYEAGAGTDEPYDVRITIEVVNANERLTDYFLEMNHLS